MISISDFIGKRYERPVKRTPAERRKFLYLAALKTTSMKLVSYLSDGGDRLAILVDGALYDMTELHPDIPGNMSMFLNYWHDLLPLAKSGEQAIREGRLTPNEVVRFVDVDVLAPVPFPTSCRDAYAFRQHVESARRNRGVPMIPEFDQYPVFYFTNPVLDRKSVV